MSRHGNLTLPNLLTVGRLVLVPFVVWNLARGELDTAFWLFCAAAITDFLDGNLARLLDQRSVLGAWLDPIADKAMLLSTLLMLVWLDVLPFWLGAARPKCRQVATVAMRPRGVRCR